MPQTSNQRDPSFPIDAVYTWVDGSDPAWQARKQQRLARLGLPPSSPSNKASRFANHDELRYSLRALEQNLPWVSRIHILTDRQRPAWLAEDHPRIRIVDHRDFFRDPAHLPCFNSLAIEANLRRVPGVAEHFIYFNDDMLVNRPFTASDFFADDGRPRSFVFRRLDFTVTNILARIAGGAVRRFQQRSIESWLRRKRDRRTPFSVALRHTQLVMLRRLDRAVPRFKTHHTPIALTRSVLDAIEGCYAETYTTCSSHPFRAADDLYFPDLYASHGIATGLTVPAHFTRADLFYFHLGRDNIRDLEKLRPGSHAFVNIDDAGSDSEDDLQSLQSTLARLYPDRAPYEVETIPRRHTPAPARSPIEPESLLATPATRGA
ncbi:MAG: Stealth CR1 domain-containing protein [Opitutaceae bacterium]|nr:Stealth CR1 domain-containing protein [Opitutaceae bacterium]